MAGEGKGRGRGVAKPAGMGSPGAPAPRQASPLDSSAPTLTQDHKSDVEEQRLREAGNQAKGKQQVRRGESRPGSLFPLGTKLSLQGHFGGRGRQEGRLPTGKAVLVCSSGGANGRLVRQGRTLLGLCSRDPRVLSVGLPPWPT